MRIHIFLASFWLLAAAYVFALPADQGYVILETGWSIGWLLLAFAGWNLLRWSLSLSSAKLNRPENMGSSLRRQQDAPSKHALGSNDSPNK